MSRSDKLLVTAATNRAAILSTLSDGAWRGATEVAAALGLHYSTIKNHMNAMAEQGQLKADKRGKGWVYAAAKELLPAVVSPRATRPARSHPPIARVGREIELVLGGETLLLGKNPATGRWRIVIEGGEG